MEILNQAAQLILCLSILVILHELGHFIPARLFKTRVEKFYLFFDPWFSIFKYKRKDTEYGIGWLPLGGYVKIAGMIDESMDKEQMKQPAQPWEFRAKKAWQRLIIMLGGVTMNVIAAIVIYIFMLSYWGEQYIPNKSLKYGIIADSTAQKIGLKSGDKIVSINGKEIENFNAIPAEILLGTPKNIIVERDRNTVEIPLTQEKLSFLIQGGRKGQFIAPRIPLVVGDFGKESNAQKAGLQVGDTIKGINGKDANFYDSFKAELVSNKSKNVEITVKRGSKEIQLKVMVSEKGMIGIAFQDFTHFIDLKTQDYTFAEAIPAGTTKAFKATSDYLKQLKLIFSPETKAYESLGGFITMGSIFTASWDWQHFWSITAFISIILAIMNLLPIPALDGGHVMFVLYEIVTGRKPSEKFLEYAQYVGMALLLGLMLYANMNDVLRLFR